MGYDKVFCVGLNKTGTTSLREAFKTLGFKVPYLWSTADVRYSVNRPDLPEVALDLCLEVINAYDVFVQHPWAWLWEEWYSRFPNARFLLTVRNPETWIKSQVRYFADEETEMRKWIYGHGSPLGHEYDYLRVFHEHNQRVQESLDCLVMDIPAGDGWESLCGFLNVDIPDVPFPNVKPK